MDKQSVNQLATEICSCREVALAINDSTHPCHKVAMIQEPILISDQNLRQRPEPWIGNLESGKILFVSSNPSISDNKNLELREDFPTLHNTDEDAGNFFINRFNQGVKRPHATFNTPGRENFLYRCNDGNYRGKGDSFNRPVETWKAVHDRAQELLGSNCDPNIDYALTEVVKCKSKGEVGVAAASPKCLDSWMSKVLAASPAKIIIIVGSKARDNFASTIPELDQNFGRDPLNYSKLGTKERSFRDIGLSNFGGVNRLYLFNWHPTSMIPNKKEMLRFENVYGTLVLNWLSSIAKGEKPLPKDSSELRHTLDQLTQGKGA